MYDKPAKKSLGQHFLHDAYFLNQMLHYLAPQQQDAFVEIGPGSGCLTDHLVSQVGCLTAIELDRDCVAHLEQKYEGMKHVSVIESDFLTFDCHQLAERSAPFRWVGNRSMSCQSCSNWSIYYADPRCFSFKKRCLNDAVLRWAKSGRSGIVLQCVFSVSQVCEVPPEAFSPPPKVDSAMFILKPLEDSKLIIFSIPSFQRC